MKNNELKQALVTLALATSLVGCSGEATNNSAVTSSPELSAIPTLTVDPNASQEGEYDNIPGLIPYYNVDAVSAIKLMSPDEQEWIYDVLTIEHPHMRYNVAVLNFNKGQFGEMNIPVGRLFINGMGSIVKYNGEYIFATNGHVLDGSYDNRENGFFLNDGITLVVSGVGLYTLSPQELKLLGGMDDPIYSARLSGEMQTVLSNMERNGYGIYPEIVDSNLQSESNGQMYYFDPVSDAVVPIRTDSNLIEMQAHFIALSDSEIDDVANPLGLEFTYHPRLCATFSGTGVVQEFNVNGAPKLFYYGGISERDDVVRYTGKVVAGRKIPCTPVNPEGPSVEELETVSDQIGAGIILGGEVTTLRTQ